jgi:hypothetical protein
MPFNLLPLNFAIICEGNELETYDVVQEGPNSTRAFVASEAGKVSVPTQDSPRRARDKTDCRDQQFHITFRNDMFDMDIVVNMYIDGERIYHGYLRAGLVGQVLGVRKTSTSVLPFKFQELELVGAFPPKYYSLAGHAVLILICLPPEDPDLEYAPVVPEMGTIELRAFRCQALRTVQYQGIPGYGLHEGRVSERSKKAGWHHVRYVLTVICLPRPPVPNSHPYMILIDPPSTADEIASAGPTCSVYADYFDPQDSPYVNLKVFYRPRGGTFHTLSHHLSDALPELLMAQGVITGHNVGAGKK